MEVLIGFSPDPSLRFGLDLCHDERTFLSDRNHKIFEGFNSLLGKSQGPQKEKEVRIEVNLCCCQLTA